MAVHHHTGMMEPMMMMGTVSMMPENSAVGISYTTDRTAFPPPQAHTSMPAPLPNQLPPQQNPPPNPSQLQVQPPVSLSGGSASSVPKSKKPRKNKKTAMEGESPSIVKLDDDVNKMKRKRNMGKSKAKSKPKKASDGTVSLLGKKGKTLDAQAREIALNVAEYFKREAELGRTLMPLHSYQKRAAAATGVSTATLRKLEGARREIRSEKVAAEGMVEDPFPDLSIDDTSFLDTTESRHKCRKCTKSRKYFCYTCCVPMPQIQDKIPKLRLPVKIDIIKHQSESDGKSTCPHAVVLAPEDVTVYTFPCIPEYDKSKVVLVFPCPEAKSLKEMAVAASSSDSAPNSSAFIISSPTTTQTDTGLHTPRPEQGLHTVAGGYTDITTSSTYADLQTIWTNPYFQTPGPSPSLQPAGTYTYLQTVPMYTHADFNSSGKRMADGQTLESQEKKIRVVTPPFERAVFIDCAWNQSKTIVHDDRLKDLPRVEMKNYTTQFWRCQEGLPTSCLSTIEAIYYFVREFHEEVLGETYLNDYDNLLFFFVYFYKKIREKYQGSKDLPKAYARKLDDSQQE